MKMTFNEAYEKLDSILESALLDYEIAVLTEAEAAEAEAEAAPAGDEGGSKAKKTVSGKFANLGGTIAKVFKKLIDGLLRLVRRLKELAIHALSIGFGPNVEIKAGAMYGTFDYFKLKEYVRDSIIAIKEGKDLPAVDHLTNTTAKDVKLSIKEVAKITSYLEKAIGTFYGFSATPEKVEKAQKVAKNLTEFLVPLTNIFNAIPDDDPKFRIKMGKGEEAGAKDVKKAAKSLGEGATPVERMALLLIEAANMIINEECDGAGCHVDGVEGGEGTQDPVDEIAEEKFVEDQEYDADVNGGEGEEPDFEEIKELCGDDKEALALLTDDEGGACCESIVITF